MVHLRVVGWFGEAFDHRKIALLPHLGRVIAAPSLEKRRDGLVPPPRASVNKAQKPTPSLTLPVSRALSLDTGCKKGYETADYERFLAIRAGTKLGKNNIDKN